MRRHSLIFAEYCCLFAALHGVACDRAKTTTADGTLSRTLEPLVLMWWSPLTAEHPPCQCDAELFAFIKDGYYGYQDQFGHIVVAPRFNRAHYRFHEGVAGVSTHDGFGYIDSTGSFLVYPTFIDGKQFHEGKAAVHNSNGWQFIDRSGRVVISEHYVEASNFVNGLAIIGVNENEIENTIRSTYTDAELNLTYYVIDVRGNRRAEVERQMEPVAVYYATREDNAFVITDALGHQVADRQFEAVHQFSEGLAGVRLSGKWGFIDTAGNLVIPCRYDGVGRFECGRAMARSGSAIKWIDASGKELPGS